MLMSDLIANMIEEMLDESNGALELKRNDLAGRVGCVPSQINYVITSRFTPERGYIIESRRGGGGYVKITRVQMTRDQYLMHLFYGMGSELDEKSAVTFTASLFDRELITEREKNLITAVVKMPMAHTVRSDMMRQILLALMK